MLAQRDCPERRAALLPPSRAFLVLLLRLALGHGRTEDSTGSRTGSTSPLRCSGRDRGMRCHRWEYLMRVVIALSAMLDLASMLVARH